MSFCIYKMGISCVGRDANEMAKLSLEKWVHSTIRDLLYNVEFRAIYSVKIA
jgi:hypothetical protein